jgi:hypothetical protein
MKHWRRWKRNGTTADPFPPSVFCRYCAERATPPDGLCAEHRRRVRTYGDPLERHVRMTDRVCLNGDGRPAWRLGLCSPCYWRRWTATHPKRPQRAAPATVGDPAPSAPTGDDASAVWYRRARAVPRQTD